MRNLFLALLISLIPLLTGCRSVENEIDELLVTVAKVGNVEYHRTGVWSDSDLSVHVSEDGSRIMHYSLSTKAGPLGPSIDITIEGIKIEDSK